MSKQFSTGSIAALSICCVLMIFTSVGCKGEGFTLAPVTGVVTADGKPVTDLKIVFYPRGTEENPTPGPFSTGMTDSEGKFTLVSRHGEPGAVVGPHRVGFELPDGMDAEALGEARSTLTEMMAEGDADPERVKAVKQDIEKIKKEMKAFAFVPPQYLKSPIIELSIPAGGLSDHPVELTSEQDK